MCAIFPAYKTSVETLTVMFIPFKPAFQYIEKKNEACFSQHSLVWRVESWKKTKIVDEWHIVCSTNVFYAFYSLY